MAVNRIIKTIIFSIIFYIPFCCWFFFTNHLVQIGLKTCAKSLSSGIPKFDNCQLNSTCLCLRLDVSIIGRTLQIDSWTGLDLTTLGPHLQTWNSLEDNIMCKFYFNLNTSDITLYFSPFYRIIPCTEKY